MPDLPERNNCLSRGVPVPASFAQCCHTMHQRTGQGRAEGKETNDRTNKIHVRKNDGKEIKERATGKE